jgi:oligopeptide/dipeptide ABC transporter ATP-binding protein
MSRPLLMIEDLRISLPGPRGRFRPVDGLDLAVGSAETVAVVGESGAGKSLTARAILGLLPAGARTAGRITYTPGEDQSVELLSADGRTLRDVRGRGVALVFQDAGAHLDPAMRVGLQVTELLRIRGGLDGASARRRARDLLARVGLPDPDRVARAWPHELSGGMQRRVTLAAALAEQPRLLVADEPTAGLDVVAAARTLELLAALGRREELAILFITHDLGLLPGFADRVVVVYAGRAVETGPAERVLGDPRHPYTRGLLACRPRPGAGRGPLPVIPGSPPRGVVPSGCAFHPRCPRAEAACAEVRPELTPLDGGRSVACPPVLAESSRGA